MVLKKKSAIIVIALIVLILGTMPICVSESRVEMNTCTNHSIAQSQTDLSGITVGIYYIGYLDSRVNNSLTTLINMFRWMNATVRIFNKTDIINGSLWGCEVLSIPEWFGPSIPKSQRECPHCGAVYVYELTAEKEMFLCQNCGKQFPHSTES